MQPDAMADGDLAPFRVDAHYYSGGLHIQAFAPPVGDASWVPSPPGDFAGYRDEFPLEKGDFAVEFARVLHRGRQLTWIAVYLRSIDAKFGDRANHAGVGVWLRDHFAREPLLLLVALRGIAEVLAERGIDAIAADVRALQSKEYLLTYIAPFRGVVPALSGWPFAAGRIAETALFVTPDGPGDAWRDVAEQIVRMTVLPAPSGTSRAIMLVSPSADRATAGGPATRIKGQVGAEIVAALPSALERAAEEQDALRRRTQKTEAAMERLNADLDRERQRAQNLSDRIVELEGQVAESDLRRRLASIDQKLDTLARPGAGAGQMDQILHEIRRIRAPASPAYGTAPNAMSRHGLVSGGWRDFHWSMAWIVGAALLVLLIVAAVIWWYSSSSDNVPPLSPGQTSQTSPQHLQPPPPGYSVEGAGSSENPPQ